VTLISDPETWADTVSAAGMPPMRARGDAGGANFRAGLVSGSLGPVRLGEFLTPGGECFRDEAGVREGDRGFCQVYLGLAGRSRLEQAGRVAEMEAADLAVIDPARPLTVVTTATRYLTVLVPQRLLGIEPDDLRGLIGRRVPGGQGSATLLTGLARAAVRSAAKLDAQEAYRSATAIAELTTAVLSTLLPQSPDEVLRARVRAFIALRLREPGLSPPGIAAAHHISVRRLHQLFRDEPLTVAALIRRSRLEKCRADLTEQPQLGVRTIAARWGFSDPAHFSRLFKAHYGRPPGDFRQAP
jgi:AraC-like DNA-binding protein